VFVIEALGGALNVVTVVALVMGSHKLELQGRPTDLSDGEHLHGESAVQKHWATFALNFRPFEEPTTIRRSFEATAICDDS
jgi:hypothetical protein